jgi:hypothetical protein
MDLTHNINIVNEEKTIKKIKVEWLFKNKLNLSYIKMWLFLCLFNI